ncbi:MAG: hypothetical protein IJ685_08330 [Selenomonadaceae bacterium]|nr:hypothetical protein [Selenomonadaceae bacterium]
MYEALTKFIPQATDATIASEFFYAVHEFVDAHPELELKQYKIILRDNNITSPKADVSSFDGKIVAAMIVGIVRRERFHEGFLKRCIENGSVAKCLLRLKEIDDGTP